MEHISGPEVDLPGLQIGSPSDGRPDPVQRLAHAFDEALDRDPDGVRERSYLFAGLPVRLRVVGGELGARTHRAFAHLRRADDDARPPLLRIDLWEETEGFAAAHDASAQLDRQWIACGGVLSASPDGRYVSFRFGDAVTILDRQGQRIIGYRRHGSHLSGGEYSKPLLLVLSIWYHDRGVQLLHSGLIAHDGAGILLPGESKTGKSTTSVAAAAHGLGFLGDDFVGLERDADGFSGHSIFNTACIVRETLPRFPAIQEHAVESDSPEEDKPILFLSEIYPDRIHRTVPIRAVALLRIGHDRTQVVRARPAEALRAFAASSLHTVVPRPGREALQLLADLVARAPAFWLLLGPELGDLPGGIEEIVSAATGGDVA